MNQNKKYKALMKRIRITKAMLKRLFTCKHDSGRVVLTGYAVTSMLGLIQARNIICVKCGTVLWSKKIVPLVVTFNKGEEQS